MKLDFTNLEKAGLVRKKTYENGLSIYKYDRKVFYKNLWGTDPLLLKARGTVLDQDGNVVVMPFDKVFNYGENGTTVHRDTQVQAIQKINGFMFAVTRHPKYGILYSTTGTMDSDFVALGKQALQDYGITTQLLGMLPGFTYLFEVCHPDDPHIIDEVQGVYLIGMLSIVDDYSVSESILDKEANRLGVLRPQHWAGRFSDVLKWSKEVEHEGFMIKDMVIGNYLCKIKSPYYLVKKFLMRMGDGKVDQLYLDGFKQTIDEEYFDLTDFITRTIPVEDWKAFTDQDRRLIIEGYLHGH